MYNDDGSQDQETEQTPVQQDTFAPAINNLYNQYYGRDADQGEIDAHRGNQGGLSAVEAALKASQAVAPADPAAPQKPVDAPSPRGVPSAYQTMTQPARTQMAAAPVWGGGSLTASGAPDAAGTKAKADALFDHLMGKAKQAETIDPNDPVIRAQSDTYSANLTRQGRSYLSELAERKGSGGNIGAESRMMSEKNAQAGAAHEGQLFQHELDSRRDEIKQALTQASQFMTAQQQMSLQSELATIENNMKLYQTQLQESQFARNLDQQGNLAREQMGQSAGQFGATMGARADEFSKNLSQRAYEYDTDDEFRRR